MNKGCRFYTKQTEEAKEALTEEMKAKIREITSEYIELDVSDEEVPQVNMMLASHNILITEIKKIESSLEDAFINITGGGNTIA